MSKKQLQVIILAAGMGTRLRPYTNNKPKCLVEINGVSLLDSQLKILKSFSISNVTIIGGYKADLLPKNKAEIIINNKYHETNMLYSLFCAESKLTESSIISYGDIVYSKGILEQLLHSKSDLSVVIDKNWKSYWENRFDDPLDDAETLKLSDKNTIIEIGKKPNSFQEINGQYIGLMKFSTKGLIQLKELYKELCIKGLCMGKPIKNAYITDFLQEAINKGYTLNAVTTSAEWIEVDSVEDLHNEITHARHSVITSEEQ